MKFEKRRYWLIPVGVAGCAALVAVVMLLWNGLLPDIFGLKTINFWQAAGLLLLCKILFGGNSWGQHRRHGHRDKHNRMHERWTNMSEEERTEFINRRMDHFHPYTFGKGEGFRKKCGRPHEDEKGTDNPQ